MAVSIHLMLLFIHDFSLFFHFIISDSPLFFKPFFVFYQPYHLPLYFPHKYVKLLVTISFFHISYISAPGKKLTHFQSPIFPCWFISCVLYHINTVLSARYLKSRLWFLLLSHIIDHLVLLDKFLLIFIFVILYEI